MDSHKSLLVYRHRKDNGNHVKAIETCYEERILERVRRDDVSQVEAPTWLHQQLNDGHMISNLKPSHTGELSRWGSQCTE